MVIGIDLDGVIFDSEKEFRVYSELYDTLILKKNSLIDSKELLFQNRYNWTDDQIKDFVKKFHKKIVIESNLMPGVKDVLKLLKEAGHRLLIITSRGIIHENEILITKKRLKEDGIDIFDVSYFAIKNKLDICKREHVDIMIDDSIKNCKKISNYGIKTIYFKDAQCYDVKENKYLKVLYNWGEIYRYITDLKSGE